MNKLLIVVCGLPGTGKTEASKKLAEHLHNFHYISQNDIRREFGMRRMPKDQDEVLREIDMRTVQCLMANEGVIFDSVNRYLFRRQQMYGIASCSNARVITLEMVCPENVAKERMLHRPPGDGLVSDSRDPRIYDKLKLEWEDLMMDFKHPGVNHVSYIQYDSHHHTMRRVVKRPGMAKFVTQIKNILTEKTSTT